MEDRADPALLLQNMPGHARAQRPASPCKVLGEDALSYKEFPDYVGAAVEISKTEDKGEGVSLAENLSSKQLRRRQEQARAANMEVNGDLDRASDMQRGERKVREVYGGLS
eukprot:2751638-Pyramimonas_sp.AAC.1